jgi:hypothetical protein
MSRRLIAFALRLYPRRWRSVHGEEMVQLTEDLLGDPRERPWHIAASMTLGALREQVRPIYVTSGRLIGTAVAGVVVVGVVVLIGRSPGADHIPASATSSGRLATVPGMESILELQHVRVTVNGVPLTVPELAGRSLGFEQSTAVHLQRDIVQQEARLRDNHGLGPSPLPIYRFSPITSVKRAIAYEVLTDLVAEKAKQDGNVVSLSKARAFAAKEDAAWHSHPERAALGLGHVVFLSAVAVASYRQLLTMNRELRLIAGPDTGANRMTALRRWMDRQLPANSVAIDGVPGLTVGNLASNLPPHL